MYLHQRPLFNVNGVPTPHLQALYSNNQGFISVTNGATFIQAQQPQLRAPNTSLIYRTTSIPPTRLPFISPPPPPIFRNPYGQSSEFLDGNQVATSACHNQVVMMQPNQQPYFDFIPPQLNGTNRKLSPHQPAYVPHSVTFQPPGGAPIHHITTEPSSGKADEYISTYQATEPAQGQKLQPEKVDAVSSSLNPNAIEFFPGNHYQPIAFSSGRNHTPQHTQDKYLPDVMSSSAEPSLPYLPVEILQSDCQKLETEGSVDKSSEQTEASVGLNQSEAASFNGEPCPSEQSGLPKPATHIPPSWPYPENQNTLVQVFRPDDNEESNDQKAENSNPGSSSQIDEPCRESLTTPEHSKLDNQEVPETSNHSTRQPTQITAAQLFCKRPTVKVKMDYDMDLLFGYQIIDELITSKKKTLTITDKFNLVLGISTPSKYSSHQIAKRINQRNELLKSLARDIEPTDSYKDLQQIFTQRLKGMGEFGKRSIAFSPEPNPEEIINMSLALHVKSKPRSLPLPVGNQLPPFVVPFTPAGTHCFDFQLPKKQRKVNDEVYAVLESFMHNGVSDKAFLASSCGLIEQLTETFPKKLVTLVGNTSTPDSITFKDIETHIKFVATEALICRLHHENITDDDGFLFLDVIEHTLAHTEAISPYRDKYPKEYLYLIKTLLVLVRENPIYLARKVQDNKCNSDSSTKIREKIHRINERRLVCIAEAFKFSLSDDAYFPYVQALLELCSKDCLVTHLQCLQAKDWPKSEPAVSELSSSMCHLIRAIGNLEELKTKELRPHSRYRLIQELEGYWLPLITKASIKLTGANTSDIDKVSRPKDIVKYLEALKADQTSIYQRSDVIQTAVTEITKELIKLDTLFEQQNQELQRRKSNTVREDFQRKEQEVDKILQELGILKTLTETLYSPDQESQNDRDRNSTEDQCKHEVTQENRGTEASTGKIEARQKGSAEDLDKQEVSSANRNPVSEISPPSAAESRLSQATTKLKTILDDLKSREGFKTPGIATIEAQILSAMPEIKEDDGIRFWVYTDLSIALLAREQKSIVQMGTRVESINALYEFTKNKSQYLPSEIPATPIDAYAWLDKYLPNDELNINKFTLLMSITKLKEKNDCFEWIETILKLIDKANSYGRSILKQGVEPNSTGHDAELALCFTTEQLVAHLEMLKKASSFAGDYYQALKQPLPKQDLANSRKKLFNQLGLGPDNSTNRKNFAKRTHNKLVQQLINLLKDDKKYLESTKAKDSQKTELNSAQIVEDTNQLLSQAKELNTASLATSLIHQLPEKS